MHIHTGMQTHTHTHRDTLEHRHTNGRAQTGRHVYWKRQKRTEGQSREDKKIRRRKKEGGGKKKNESTTQTAGQSKTKNLSQSGNLFLHLYGARC